MNEEFKINPAVYKEFLRIKTEKEVSAYLRKSLLDKFGTAPTAEELRQYYKDEGATEIDGFTSEQKFFAMEKMLEYSLKRIQPITDAALYTQLLEMDDPTDVEEFMERYFPEDG